MHGQKLAAAVGCRLLANVEPSRRACALAEVCFRRSVELDGRDAKGFVANIARRPTVPGMVKAAPGSAMLDFGRRLYVGE